jgi:hypothetical protein
VEYFVPQRIQKGGESVEYFVPQRIQKGGESVEYFVRNLYELAEYCEFGTTKDEQIRDRIVIGMMEL